MTRRSVLSFLFCGLVLATGADAYSQTSGDQQRPKVALVMGGGGAHGVAHLGVLEELERQKVPVDLIVGTGFGSIIGGLYASGMTTEEMREFLFETDWVNIFDPDTQREDLSFRRKQDDDDFLIKYSVGVKDGQAQLPTSLVPNKKLSQLLQTVTARSKLVTDFDHLPVPFRTVAMDLITGEEVVLDSGALDRAMLASFSTPGTFEPIRIDGRTLITGSLINNLPVDVAREWGADVVIVVDIGIYIRGEDDLNSIFSIVDQVGHLMQEQNSVASLQTLNDTDILIRTDTTPNKEVNIGDPTVNVDRGAASVTAVADRLDSIRTDASSFALINDRRVARGLEIPVISRIELRNESSVDDAVILAQITQPLNEQLDPAALEADIGNVFGIGSFSSVEFGLVPEGDTSVLELHTIENRKGNRIWRFGLSLQDDLEGNSAYTGSASMTWTNLNSLGGEWRNVLRIGDVQQISTEFYQPLVRQGRWFSRAAVGYEERNVNIFNDGDILGQARVRELIGQIGAGRIFGNSGQISAGFIYGGGSSSSNIGARVPSTDFDTAGFTLAAAYDTYDNVYFPKRGATATVAWVGQQESLGASFDVDIVTGRFGIAKTWDVTTLIGGVTLQSQLNDVEGAQNLLQTGGLFNLSGYQRDELTGRHTGVGRLILYRRMRTNPLRGFMNASLYFGASLEAGGAWASSDDVSIDNTITAGSIFAGADTFIGPVYLAGGLAEGGKTAMYLFVGRPF